MGESRVEFCVDAQQVGMRLDRLLRKLFPNVALSAVFAWLRKGKVRVDGQRAAGALRLQLGMRLSLPGSELPSNELPANERPAAALVPSELAPAVVHRDTDLLVLNKPAGLAAQPGTGRAGRNVVDWLQGYCPECRSATFTPAPAHRLDAQTSGLLAVGLTPLGSRGLAAAFRDGQAHKTYFALVQGVPAVRAGCIDAPLLVCHAAQARERKVVVDPKGQASATEYEVVELRRSAALLKLRPLTGRMHQLRAHLAHLGHPILGDVRYGAKPLPTRRFLLHAAELELPHPSTGARVRFVAPLPADFVNAAAP